MKVVIAQFQFDSKGFNHSGFRSTWKWSIQFIFRKPINYYQWKVKFFRTSVYWIAYWQKFLYNYIILNILYTISTMEYTMTANIMIASLSLAGSYFCLLKFPLKCSRTLIAICLSFSLYLIKLETILLELLQKIRKAPT